MAEETLLAAQPRQFGHGEVGRAVRYTAFPVYCVDHILFTSLVAGTQVTE